MLARVLRRVGRAIHGASSLVTDKLRSPDPIVRTAAVEAAAALRISSAAVRVRELLADRDPGVRRSAAMAARALGLKDAIDPLVNLRTTATRRSGRASLDALRRLHEPRAVPRPSGARRSRNPIGRVLCVAELGGPDQGSAVADLAKRSPTAEVFPLAVRTLTDWSRRTTIAPQHRFGLEQSVADVQGATGLFARWEVCGPLPSGGVDSLVSRIARPERPFDVTARVKSIGGPCTPRASRRECGSRAAAAWRRVRGGWRSRTSPCPSRRGSSSWPRAMANGGPGLTASASTRDRMFVRCSRIPTGSRSTWAGG